MADLTCPFCDEDGFDDVGLALHLGSDCKQYDNACRRASDFMDRRYGPLTYRDTRAQQVADQNTKEPK